MWSGKTEEGGTCWFEQRNYWKEICICDMPPLNCVLTCQSDSWRNSSANRMNSSWKSNFMTLTCFCEDLVASLLSIKNASDFWCWNKHGTRLLMPFFHHALLIRFFEAYVSLLLETESSESSLFMCAFANQTQIGSLGSKQIYKNAGLDGLWSSSGSLCFVMPPETAALSCLSTEAKTCDFKNTTSPL